MGSGMNDYRGTVAARLRQAARENVHVTVYDVFNASLDESAVGTALATIVGSCVCDAVTYDYNEYEELHGNVNVLVLLAELIECGADD